MVLVAQRNPARRLDRAGVALLPIHERRAMTQHAIDRARERYGLELTEQDIEALRGALVAGRAVLLKQMPDGYRHMMAMLGERALIVVWHPERQAIITVLPKNARKKAVPLGRKPPAGRRPETPALVDADE